MKPEETEKIFFHAYNKYSDALYRHAFYRVYDEESAKDLMQDAYMRCWDYLVAGNEIVNIRAFLYRVLNNLIIDRSRKKSTVSLDTIMEEGFVPSEEDAAISDRRQDAREVLKLLDGIDMKYRDVIVMRYIDELSIKEIADILNEKENAISVRLHRGFQMVTKYMEIHQK